MSLLSRLVRVKQLSLGRPDLFFIDRTRHRRPLFTTTRPDTLLKWRQISTYVISYKGLLTKVKTEEGEERPRSSSGYSKKRRTLPKELLRNVVVLTCERVGGGTCDVYLVGTDHFSQESCREVQAVISQLRPQVVFLELCAGRVHQLRPTSLKDLKVPTTSEVIDQCREAHNPLEIVFGYHSLLAADELKVIPGSEFRVAYEEAKKWGSKVILGDRPIDITLARLWASFCKMTLWQRAKMRRSLRSGASIDKVIPAFTETIDDERDQYMSSTLLAVAGQHRSVVAVVGKDHLPGIKKYWKQPVEMEKLMEIPSKFSIKQLVEVPAVAGVGSFGLTAIFGVAIVYLAANNGS